MSNRVAVLSDDNRRIIIAFLIALRDDGFQGQLIVAAAKQFGGEAAAAVMTRSIRIVLDTCQTVIGIDPTKVADVAMAFELVFRVAKALPNTSRNILFSSGILPPDSLVTELTEDFFRKALLKAGLPGAPESR